MQLAGKCGNEFPIGRSWPTRPSLENSRWSLVDANEYTPPMAALVLIADDEDGVRFGLVALCQQAGYRTIEAASGREVLEQVATHQPDLVLLDLNMPHGSGLDILPQLVEPADAPSVVILTGFADVGTAVQAMRLGADNLLEKPVSSEDLR
ncbi:MAG: FixJ family two-component response regulator, partial [Planctomycetota bacterium]